MLMERGQIPYFITFLTTWSLGILWVKSMKLKLQRKALQLPIMPSAADYVLAPRTAPIILRRIYAMVDNPRHFVVLNRIEAALSNLRNIGRISDVSEILTTQAGNDDDHMVSSYSLVKGFVWAIPVLGFVGTVLGLSEAIGSFGGVLSKSEDLANLTIALKDVTAGLSVAFDTTLLGLVASLFVQLLIVTLMKREEDFLHDCTEFCHIQVVGRLRLLDADQPAAPAKN
ncbi:MAG: MotA/TolQ/ExbB proton channel family protein [Lentisphaeria bacterium]|nr:MotA/TolQ/ExbB proton channel family protein [Lentisphaeria bacterium]